MIPVLPKNITYKIVFTRFNKCKIHETAKTIKLNLSVKCSGRHVRADDESSANGNPNLTNWVNYIDGQRKHIMALFPIVNVSILYDNNPYVVDFGESGRVRVDNNLSTSFEQGKRIGLGVIVVRTFRGYAETISVLRIQRSDQVLCNCSRTKRKRLIPEKCTIFYNSF